MYTLIKDGDVAGMGCDISSHKNMAFGWYFITTFSVLKSEKKKKKTVHLSTWNVLWQPLTYLTSIRKFCARHYPKRRMDCWIIIVSRVSLQEIGYMWNIILKLIIQSDTHQHHYHQLRNWWLKKYISFHKHQPISLAGCIWAGNTEEMKQSSYHQRDHNKKVFFCRWFQSLSCINFSFKIEFPPFSHSVKFVFLPMLNLYIPKARIQKQTSLFPNYLWRN